MELCADFVRSLTPVCVEHDVRFGAIGELDELFTPTRHAIETLVEASAKRAGLKLTLGIAYASRRDLAQAARELATLARAGVLMLEEIDEQALHRAMSTKDLPPVDLLITTGSGERLSDFLLFECARADVRFRSSTFVSSSFTLFPRNSSASTLSAATFCSATLRPRRRS